jgi:hypothetical protein
MKISRLPIVIASLAHPLAPRPGRRLKGTVKARGQEQRRRHRLRRCDCRQDLPAPSSTRRSTRRIWSSIRTFSRFCGNDGGFLNSDATLHNVFSPDKCADRVQPGELAAGRARSHLQGSLRRLLCNVHPGDGGSSSPSRLPTSPSPTRPGRTPSRACPTALHGEGLASQAEGDEPIGDGVRSDERRLRNPEIGGEAPWPPPKSIASGWKPTPATGLVQ